MLENPDPENTEYHGQVTTDPTLWEYDGELAATRAVLGVKMRELWFLKKRYKRLLTTARNLRAKLNVKKTIKQTKHHAKNTSRNTK